MDPMTIVHQNYRVTSLMRHLSRSNCLTLIGHNLQNNSLVSITYLVPACIHMLAKVDRKLGTSILINDEHFPPSKKRTTCDCDCLNHVHKVTLRK